MPVAQPPAESLAAAMLAAGTPIILTNPRLPDNPIIAANEAFCALSGYAADELIGRNCRFLQCDETDRDVIARLRTAIAAAEPVEVVLRNCRRNGERFWNRLLVAPVVGPGGEVLYFFANQRDVTAEVERLAQLEGRTRALEDEVARRVKASGAEDGERLRQSQRAAGAASWEWDPRSGEIRWSEGFEAVLGPLGPAGTPPDLDAWLARIHPGDRGRARAGAAAIQGGAGRFEYRLEQDGEIRWLECIGRVLTRDGAGQPAKATGIVLDVTERKAAELRGRQNAVRLRALIETTPIAVFVTDPHGQKTYVSPHLTAYTGLPEQALLGHGWLRTVAEGDREHVTAVLQDTLAARESYEVECRLRRHDGVLRWFLVRGVPLHDAPEPAVIGWCGTLTDIEEQVEAREALNRSRVELERLVAQRTEALTAALEALRFEAGERARAEEALRQAQKMEAIGQLTGGVAHDFNNLLTAISGSLELLQSRLAQGRPADADRHIAAARRAVERGTGLTHRLLAFARRQALDPQPVAVDRLIRDMVELIRRSVGTQVEVAVRLDADAASTLCDANQLESALLNLAINARDAMPSGGCLTLATATRQIADNATARPALPAGSYVEIAVIDTGSGMPPDVRERAFDPFFSTKPLGQGTGLGLSQTYGFVRQSGGFVLLESQAGVGTTVRLLLPRHAGAEAGTPEPVLSARTALPRGARVLVVDDEATLRELIVESLQELGCHVLSAADGPAALEIVRSEAAIDLLVTDVGLPGLDGRRLAEAARAARPGLPILFITGYAGDAAEDPAASPDLPSGMHVIGKPFTLAALTGRLTAMLREQLSDAS